MIYTIIGVVALDIAIYLMLRDIGNIESKKAMKSVLIINLMLIGLTLFTYGLSTM